MREKHLINPEEFTTLARPVSVHIDEIEVTQFIDECEDMFIIPHIGYGNFKAAVGMGTFDSTFDASFTPAILICGGEWEDTEACGCGDDGKKVLKYCKGLKATLAYYVYAKMLRSDGSIISRAGYMRHEDDYSGHVDDNQKQYTDVMDIADSYMKGCLEYLRFHTVDKRIKKLIPSRGRIRAIGD